MKASMIATTDYPELRNFLACAFHQDWEETAETYERVVDVDVAAEPAGYLDQVARECAALLTSSATDAEIAAWLTAVGAYVILENDGYTPRSFVAMIEARIRLNRTKR
jgi:CdiI immunity protein